MMILHLCCFSVRPLCFGMSLKACGLTMSCCHHLTSLRCLGRLCGSCAHPYFSSLSKTQRAPSSNFDSFVLFLAVSCSVVTLLAAKFGSVGGLFCSFGWHHHPWWKLRLENWYYPGWPSGCLALRSSDLKISLACFEVAVVSFNLSCLFLKGLFSFQTSRNGLNFNCLKKVILGS